MDSPPVFARPSVVYAWSGDKRDEVGPPSWQKVELALLYQYVSLLQKFRECYLPDTGRRRCRCRFLETKWLSRLLSANESLARYQSLQLPNQKHQDTKKLPGARVVWSVSLDAVGDYQDPPRASVQSPNPVCDWRLVCCCHELRSVEESNYFICTSQLSESFLSSEKYPHRRHARS